MPNRTAATALLSLSLLGAGLAVPAVAYRQLDDNGLCPGGIAFNASRFSSGGSLDFDLSINHVKLEMAAQKGLNWDDLDFLERFELVIWPFETTARELSGVGGSQMRVAVNLGGQLSTETDVPRIVDELMGNLQNDVVFSLVPAGEFSAITFNLVHSNCIIRESDVIFADPPAGEGWLFHEPRDYGVPYYDDRLVAGDWMQLAFLHEMLHAVGFEHTADTYSFLNYGHLPWTKLDAASLDKEVPSPLPDDRLALRDVYSDPAGGGQFDLAVANTWLDESVDLSNGAASQGRLCTPTWAREDLANSGHWLELDRFGLVGCHPQSGNEVCPGSDSVAFAYAVSNNGRDPEWVIHELWFSADDVWDPAQDILAPGSSATLETLDQETSRIAEQIVEVPAGLAPGEYHLIARLRRFATAADQPGSGLRESSYRNNWIPLRGRIRTPPASRPCP